MLELILILPPNYSIFELPTYINMSSILEKTSLRMNLSSYDFNMIFALISNVSNFDKISAHSQHRNAQEEYAQYIYLLSIFNGVSILSHYGYYLNIYVLQERFLKNKEWEIYSAILVFLMFSLQKLFAGAWRLALANLRGTNISNE